MKRFPFVITVALLMGASMNAATNYVWQGSPNPTPPYSSWETAAHVIQDAVDAAADGDTVLVTNGVYATGGTSVAPWTTNRVTVEKPLNLLSVNGPEVTIIDGLGSVRCAYLTDGACLIGFTIANGRVYDFGGGIYCTSSDVLISECKLIGNDTSGRGGGVILGMLKNCMLTGNSANTAGGAWNSTLVDCTLLDNEAFYHGEGSVARLAGVCGGAWSSTLINCTLVGNSATYGLGGASGFLTNCIVYFNNAPTEPNIFEGSEINYTCTYPLATNGVGNITNAPLFLDTNNWADLRLRPESPCIDAGHNDFVTSLIDLEGNPRIRNGTVDMGAYEYQPPPVTHCVNKANPSPVPPYTNWATAATNIQDAVDAAYAGDTVLVTNGVYRTGGKSVDGFSTSRVAVEKPLMLLSVNGPEATFIHGEEDEGIGIQRCVFLVEGATLSGFTLTNGRAWFGGGILCESTGAVVSNCVVSGNLTYYGGGEGGGAYGGTLNNCTLTGNSSSFGGGAASAILKSCNLTGNSAVGGIGGMGGGAYECTLINCVLTGNDQGGRGGGGGAAFSTLTNCTLVGNSAGAWGGSWGGGAMDCTLHDCVLMGNTAGSGGGAATFGMSTDSSTLNNCLLIGNLALIYGGGVWGSTLNNCTLTENSAGQKGGGAWISTLNNCIAYLNTSPEQPNYSTNTTLNYTCTYPMPTNGVGNITNAPLFVDTNNWADLRLRPDSPCIDAGNNDLVTALMDLDGNPRIFNGIVDMGAYEFVPLTPYELVEKLIAQVSASDLQHKQPLLATLEAALASIELENCHSAVGQLHAFQNKVAAQVTDMNLALTLVENASAILTALNCDGGPRVAARIRSLKRHSNGRMHMNIQGAAEQVYILETSTNLVDWEATCVLAPDKNGACEFHDADLAELPCRFYRMKLP